MKLIISILIYFINIIESLPLLHKSLITLRVLNDEKSIKYKQIIIEEWNHDLDDIYQTWIIPAKKSIDNNVTCTFFENNLIKLRCENLNCNKIWFQCNNQEVNASYSNETQILNSYIDTNGSLEIQNKSTNLNNEFIKTLPSINENKNISWLIDDNKLIRINILKKESFELPNNSSWSNIFGSFEKNKFVIYLSNGTSIFKNDYNNLINNVSFSHVLQINSNWILKSFLIRSSNNSKFIKPTSTITKSNFASYTPVATPVQVNVDFNSNVKKFTSPSNIPKTNTYKKNLTKNLTKVFTPKVLNKNTTNVTKNDELKNITNVTKNDKLKNITNVTKNDELKNITNEQNYKKLNKSSILKIIVIFFIIILVIVTTIHICKNRIKKKRSFYNLELEFDNNEDKWSLPTISTPSSISDSPRPTF
jgi:hypothetical protein